MKTELNPEDKERIEQEAFKRVENDVSIDYSLEKFAAKQQVIGAEYATRYEREDGPMKEKVDGWMDMCNARDRRIKQLEAERSELLAWKESEMKLWGPVLDYAQNHGKELGIKPGEWISEKIVSLLSKFEVP